MLWAGISPERCGSRVEGSADSPIVSRAPGWAGASPWSASAIRRTRSEDAASHRLRIIGGLLEESGLFGPRHWQSVAIVDPRRRGIQVVEEAVDHPARGLGDPAQRVLAAPSDRLDDVAGLGGRVRYVDDQVVERDGAE